MHILRNLIREFAINEIADKSSFARGPGIVLSRVGGWSPVRQENPAAPEREGLWAFIAPYFEPFLLTATDDEGITTDTSRPSRYDLMKRNKGRDPSLGLRRTRYVGQLYTRLKDVPGSSMGSSGWHLTDADTLREYVFGSFRPKQFADQASSWGIKRKEDMIRYSKDHFEVFVPRGNGRFIDDSVSPVRRPRHVPDDADLGDDDTEEDT